jgi:hypothetical protein
MTSILAADRTFFQGGPLDKLQRRIGLIRDGEPRTVRRALLATAIMWLPLVVLAAAHGDLIGRGTWNPFLLDFGALTRFLIVPSLLIFAGSFCLPRLGRTAARFVEGGLVRASDHPRYLHAVSSTARLMNSTWVEGIAVVLSYGLVAALFLIAPVGDLPRWHGVRTAAGFVFSPAGWWAALVSLPLLVLLELGWVWRLCLWTRFLWLMSRLDLRLVAAHPDHAAGLKFVEHSLRAFLPLELVLGVLVAGPVLNRVVHQNAPPLQFKFLIAGTAVLSVILFAGPLLVFIGRLIDVQLRSGSAYGTLAARMGQQFEDKWLSSETTLGEEALSVSDFSATTDLYSIVSNVYAMQIVPLALKNLTFPIAVTLVPFFPLLLLSVPADVILRKLAALFL